jgi:DNA repair protein RecO (recombination protein O)
MQWSDTAFVLGSRRHGENALIVELLTRERGRHAGLVRGGQSPRRRALLQPGNKVAASWRGRLAEHLGTLDCELIEPHAARFLDDPDRLAALDAAVALLIAALPEREPHPGLYLSFADLLAALAPTFPSPASGGGEGRGSAAAPDSRDISRDIWMQAYVGWECELLASVGFGLDLARCAVTGTNQDLAYVSPRTGRAVTREAGAPYKDKLLPLPGFLWRPNEPAVAADIVAGLVLTRHFLLHHLLEPQGGRLPEARDRLFERIRRFAVSDLPVV